MNPLKIICGDSLAELRKLPDESCQMCCTSPPYWGLRDYGVDGQIGLEDTPEIYVAKMVDVFREVKRVLRKDGTCWVNLGSSYASGDRPANQSLQSKRVPACGNGGKEPQDFQVVDRVCPGCGDGFPDGTLNHCPGNVHNGRSVSPDAQQPCQKGRDNARTDCVSSYPGVSLPGAQESTKISSLLNVQAASDPSAKVSVCPPESRPSSPDVLQSVDNSCLNFSMFSQYVKPKDMVPIPWMVAMALQKDGWYLRSDIIWKKPNPMPESVTDRCTKSHEYVFMLTKSASYFWDAEAVKERLEDSTIARYAQSTPMTISGQFKGSPTDKRHKSDDGKKINGADLPTSRNRRSVWTIPSEAFNGDVSYGKCRIASPDCPVHDYQADRARALEYGEQLIASESDHNPGKPNHPYQVQEGAFVSIPLGPCASLFDETSAICHSSGSRKTGDGSKQGAIFYGISPDRIGCMAPLFRLISRFFHSPANRTSEAVSCGEQSRGLPESSDRIVGILTFEQIQDSCCCKYTGQVEKRQDHFACFPKALVKPCILAGTSARGCCNAPVKRLKIREDLTDEELERVTTYLQQKGLT